MRFIHQWQRVAYDLEVEKGFYDDPSAASNLDSKLLLAIGELIEAQNELRAGRTPAEIYYKLESEHPDKPEGFGIELADAVIRICGIAELTNVDLEACMTKKYDYNNTRPYKHGKKF